MSWLQLLLVITLIYYAYSCNSFKTIEVELGVKQGNSFKQTVRGCISRKTLNTSSIVNQVSVVKQPVQRLSHGAVENMASLVFIEFSRCNIETVQTRAFRNVPQLSRIYINYGLIKEIQKEVFYNIPSLIKISLVQNNISKIEVGAFAIPSLQIIHIWNNKLTKWNPDWFANYEINQFDVGAFGQLTNQSKTCGQNCKAENLTEVGFKDNLLTEIPSYAFRNLPKLEKIVLDSNSISRIEPNAFFGLDNLKNLGLAYNRLATIDLNWFPNRVHLSKLTVNANKLNYISLDTLQQISPEIIALDGNPWSCACQKKVTSWIHEKSLKILTTDICNDDNVPICIESEDDVCRDVVDELCSERYYSAVKMAVKDMEEVKRNKCYRFD